MSYTLHVWESPVPGSLDQADQIVSRLAVERCPQKPKFFALAKRLTARYPCMTTIGPDEETAWSDGPLDGRTERPVYGIGLQGHAVAEALPFVAHVARQLGLVLLDAQAGTVYLPDGSTLGAVPATVAATAPILTRDSIAQTLMQAVTPILQPLGFKANLRQRKLDRRASSEVSQVVYFEAERRWDGFLVYVLFHVKPKLSPALKAVAERYLNAATLDQARLAAGTGVPADRFDSTSTFEAQVDRPDDLEVLVPQLRVVAERAAEVFRACTSMKDLHRLLNEVPPAESPFCRGTIHQFVAATFGRQVLDETHLRQLAQRHEHVHEQINRIYDLILDALSAPG